MSTSHETHLDKFTFYKSDFWYGAVPGDRGWVAYKLIDHVPATYLDTSGGQNQVPRPYLWYYSPCFQDIYNYSAGSNNFNVLCSYYTQMKVCRIVIDLKPVLTSDNLIIFPDDSAKRENFDGYNNSYASTVGYCTDPLARQLLANNVDNSIGTAGAVPHGWDDILSQRTNGHKHRMDKPLRIVIAPRVSVPIASARLADNGNNVAAGPGSVGNINIGPPTDFEWCFPKKFPWIPSLGGTNAQDTVGGGAQYLAFNQNTPSIHGAYLGFPRNLYQIFHYQYSITWYVAFKNRRGSYYANFQQR